MSTILIVLIVLLLLGGGGGLYYHKQVAEPQGNAGAHSPAKGSCRAPEHHSVEALGRNSMEHRIHFRTSGILK